MRDLLRAACLLATMACAVAQTTCPDGQSAHGATCQPCRVGFAGTGGRCARCAAGRQANYPTSTECTQCPEGLYRATTMSRCQPCISGYHADPDRKRCQPCDGESAGRDGSCAACGEGEQPIHGHTECGPCPEGYATDPNPDGTLNQARHCICLCAIHCRCGSDSAFPCGLPGPGPGRAGPVRGVPVRPAAERAAQPLRAV